MYARYLKAFEANSEMNIASLQSILRGLEYIISIQVWYALRYADFSRLLKHWLIAKSRACQDLKG